MPSDLESFIGRIPPKRLWQFGGAVVAPSLAGHFLPNNSLATLASIPLGYYAGGDIYEMFKDKELSSLEEFIK